MQHRVIKGYSTSPPGEPHWLPTEPSETMCWTYYSRPKHDPWVAKVLRPLGQFTPNTGKVFGYLDDVIGDSGELVQVTEVMFDFTPKALCADASLENLAPKEGGPFDTLKGRKSFCIPFGMVPWVLGKGLAPCQAFLLFLPHLEAHFLQEDCAPLMDTL
eukprot:jgi/Psemu1/17831/gm1.17831_g